MSEPEKETDMSQASAASKSGVEGNLGAGAINIGQGNNVWYIVGAVVVVALVIFFIFKPAKVKAA